ncbi:MAG: hypothetical protein ACE5GO_04350 [Anaerolineales bacterium]
MTEFSPRNALEHTLKTWWVVLLLTLLGGAAGWRFHQTRPPIYQAKAILTVNVDYTQTGAINERDVDHILGTVGAFFNSNVVLGQVVEQANAQQIEIDLPTLRDISTLERRRSLWQIYIHHSDPQVAFTLANLWGEIALAKLTDAHQHAVQVQALQTRLNTLGNCVPYPEPPTAGFQSCRLQVGTDLQWEIGIAADELEQVKAASHGIFPALLFDLTQPATLPTEPVAFGRNTLVFFGAVLGFMIGILGAGYVFRLTSRDSGGNV